MLDLSKVGIINAEGVSRGRLSENTQSMHHPVERQDLTAAKRLRPPCRLPLRVPHTGIAPGSLARPSSRSAKAIAEPTALRFLLAMWNGSPHESMHLQDRRSARNPCSLYVTTNARYRSTGRGLYTHCPALCFGCIKHVLCQKLQHQSRVPGYQVEQKGNV